MTQKRDMLIWPNWLRAIAIIAVVATHIAAEIVIINTPSISWHIANLWICFSRFCVAAFLMLTGSFLLSKDKNIEIRPFLRKRLSRVVYPFLFWSLFYYIYNIYSYCQLGRLTDLSSFLNLTTENILSGTSYQLWYVYMLIGVYLAIPLLNKWIKVVTERDLLYFFILWIIGFCIKILAPGSNFDLTFAPFIGLLGFVILGYYLFNKNYQSKNIAPYSLLIFILSCIGATLWSTYLNRNGGTFNGDAYKFETPFMFIASIAIFLFAKYSKLCSKQNKIIDLLSRYSYGIYLNHVLILIAFKHIGITYNFIHPVFSIPLLTIICLALSIGLLYILNKIPILNKLTGA